MGGLIYLFNDLEHACVDKTVPAFTGADIQRSEQVGDSVAFVNARHHLVPTGIIGTNRWVRSDAWHRVFPSKLNTTAASDAFSYRPSTSVSFSSKFGSFDNLIVWTFHGLTLPANRFW